MHDGGLQGSIAYVLKGYPRPSETFIGSEIYRLERQGLRLRLFVLKPGDAGEPPPVIARIAARPEYLPPTAPVSDVTLVRWLATHLPAFLPALGRVARTRPRGLARAAAAAAAQAVRARRGWWAWPRKVYVKELLQAVALADRVAHAGDVRHLHAHFCHGTTTVAWLASLITGVPFSFTAHAKDLYQGALNPAGLLRRKLEAARFAVTCTATNHAYLRQVAPAAPVHCVYHGLNADLAALVAAAPAAPGGAADGFRVLGVGRLVPKKGFDVLVEACALLRARGVALQVRIAGEPGEHTSELRARIAAHKLGQAVTLTGALGQAALFAEYRRAGVFCLPCRVLADGDRDGIPNVLVEAMACGLPVISTPVSGIPELVVDGVNGLLVPANDPAALAAAIRRVHDDPALARRLGEAAQATVRERFDGERLATRLAALFRPLLEAA